MIFYVFWTLNFSLSVDKYVKKLSVEALIVVLQATTSLYSSLEKHQMVPLRINKYRVNLS